MCITEGFCFLQKEVMFSITENMVGIAYLGEVITLPAVS